MQFGFPSYLIDVLCDCYIYVDQVVWQLWVSGCVSNISFITSKMMLVALKYQNTRMNIFTCR